MNQKTIETVEVNLPKFKEVRGDMSLSEFAELVGYKVDMVSKIERGKRWAQTLQKFGEYCARTNSQPNDFFTIKIKS